MKENNVDNQSIYALVKKLHGGTRAEWDTAPIVDPTQTQLPMGQPPGGATIAGSPSPSALAQLTAAPPPEMNPETPFQSATGSNMAGSSGGSGLQPDKIKSLMNRFRVARQNKTGGLSGGNV